VIHLQVQENIKGPLHLRKKLSFYNRARVNSYQPMGDMYWDYLLVDCNAFTKEREKKMCNYKGGGRQFILACCLKKNQGSSVSHTAWQHSLIKEWLQLGCRCAPYAQDWVTMISNQDHLHWCCHPCNSAATLHPQSLLTLALQTVQLLSQGFSFYQAPSLGTTSLY
jgi:hypothetical protein